MCGATNRMQAIVRYVAENDIARRKICTGIQSEVFMTATHLAVGVIASEVGSTASAPES